MLIFKLPNAKSTNQPTQFSTSKQIIDTFLNDCATSRGAGEGKLSSGLEYFERRNFVSLPTFNF